MVHSSIQFTFISPILFYFMRSTTDFGNILIAEELFLVQYFHVKVAYI